MDFKAVIFDLDGTLYESRHLPFRLVMADIFHVGILKAERKARHEIMGRCFKGGADEVYATLFGLIAREKSMPEGKVSSWFWCDYMPDMVKVLRRHYKVRDGVREKLEALRAAGVKTAVLSDYGMVHDKLLAIGADPGWFDFISDAPTLGGLKPCREVFLAVCDALEVKPSDALMVGDRKDTDGGAVDVGMGFLDIREQPYF